MQKRPLFWQVFPTYVLLTTALLALLLLEGTSWLSEFYRDQTAADLARSASMFGETAKQALEREDYAEVDALAKRLGSAAELRITVVLADGKVVAESNEDPSLLDKHRTRPEIAKAIDTRAMAYNVRESRTMQRDYLYVAVPLLRDETPWAVVRIATPAPAVEAALAALKHRIFYSTLIAVLVMVVASWVIARRITYPLEIITRGAARFARGELDAKLPMEGSREIVALAETLNLMASELKDQLQTAAFYRSEQEAVLFSMDEGVLTVDKAGSVLGLNRAAEQMFSVTNDKARGRPIHEVLRKADVLRFVENALKSELPLQENIVIYDKDRHLLTAHGNELRNARNQRIGILIVFREIKQIPPQST